MGDADITTLEGAKTFLNTYAEFHQLTTVCQGMCIAYLMERGPTKFVEEVNEVYESTKYGSAGNKLEAWVREILFMHTMFGVFK